jgi:hypothetical protein
MTENYQVQALVHFLQLSTARSIMTMHQTHYLN